MSTASSNPVHAKRAGFLRDVVSLGGRALRSIPRDPESIIPALIIPVFFFAVNVGALQDLAERMEGIDYKAFQLPVAILFAVTGVTRANILVIDIQGGYFDRLALTPVNRLAMLLGFMVADLVLVVSLSIPVIALGFIVGVRFETGFLGLLAFLGISGLWAIAYNGFPYAVALKTGNPAAVNSSFLLFMPVTFLTTVFVPAEALTGWMSEVIKFNPVTYLLEGMRSLIVVGWDAGALLGALAGIGAVALLSVPLALWSLAGRVRRN
ncbi:MAG: ABC transporter permease, partial [Chloroflexi bacterium]|nr:ABC transporter permease [Chloroflexota bacterium]